MRFLTAFLLAVCMAGPVLAAADYVWIEGENPTTSNFEVKGVGWGNKQYLSKEAWVHVVIDKDIEKTAPAGGVVLGYDFEAPSAGRYEVWNRIGFEFVRSLIQWRIDNGEWNDVAPADLTTDLMEIALWCEVAWIRMGAADLAPGKHTLQVRLPVTLKEEKDGKKAAQRILYASDALCLSKAEFRPHSRFKPDEAWQDQIDMAAAGQVFEAKAQGKPEDRIETPLAGTWQIARFDEQAVEDRAGPVKALPKAGGLFWHGIKVPGDRNVLRPDFVFCHRYFYRTRVKVPAELKGRGFFLHFPSVNMIAAVFVNGQPCGWTKAPLAPWDCDITKAVRPGEANEIWVAVKDTYYAIAKDIRKSFNWPPPWLDSLQGMSMQLDFPVWNHRENGILETPTLVACGPVYTADVFAQPLRRKKELSLDIAVKNPGAVEAAVMVDSEIVPLEGGPAEMKFAPREVKVAAGKEEVLNVTAPWENPKLWWPDAPHQYVAVTTLSAGGKVIDTARTKFGYREWTWDGRQFKLNGVPWQGRADLAHHSTRNPQEAVETWRKHGQTMFRFWAARWGGMGTQDALDFLDSGGVCVRRSGVFDGEMASYGLGEEVEQGGKKQRVARKDLFENWAAQLKAQIRGERNHPSIFIWSIENEIVYINSLNLGQASYVEPAVAAVAREVMALDPTRPVMVDGGQALTDLSLPVVGGHYLETAQRDYPDQAYTLESTYATKSRNQWPTPRDRPMFLGESFFARGENPAWFAGLGGESAFLGRSETIRPCGLYAKMLSEGYRWHGLAAFHFWFGDEDAQLHYNSWQPVCVLCREWNWTFGGGTTVSRTLKVFNDTHHADPIEMAWQFTLGGKAVVGDTKTFHIGPGLSEVAQVSVKVPAVKDRTAGQFILTCRRGGKEVFREAKDVAVIDAGAAANPSVAKADLLVLDPGGAVKKRLAARGIGFTEAATFEDVPEKVKVLVVGQDALTPAQATDPRWQALAAGGARILVLDQAAPLHYLAVPADFEVTDYVGRIAFAENLEHPVFAGLDQPDFFTWSGDHVVYRNAYKKASKGAKSLAQCDLELGCSAIAECPVGEGVILACQMVVGEKLATDPVAQRLFDNMLAYVAGYKTVRKETAVAMAPSAPEARMLAASGLRFDTAADPVSAVSDGRHEIVVAAATPANLKALAADLGKVKAFAQKGGWLMLWGLTPDGLADFNTIVGVNHVLRPFEMERVTLPAVRDPVLSGLTMRDVVMESGEKITAWTGDKFLANDVFTYIVDFDDAAPFCDIPGPEYWNEKGARPGYDHWPRNMVNGFVTADSWKYIFSIALSKGEPTKWPMKLPREEQVIQFSIAPNAIYHKVTKVNLFFDDDPRPVALTTRPTGERQDFIVGPRKARVLTVELAEWQKSGTADVVGVDNIWIRVKRPEDFPQRVKPLLNIGALVKYPVGRGGILLNQVRVLAIEPVPINAQKKQTIVATLLRNLGAVYAGGRTLAGASLTYEPVPLDDQCNQYLTKDRGWFDGGRDLGHLPGGEQKFGGVTYVIRDFKTSPAASCVMLAGPGAKGRLPNEVKGLKVGKKADLLFFLHAFRQEREWRPRGQDVTPPVVFRYVVHYADGKTAEVPVLYGEGVGHWLTRTPAGLKSAALAWAAAAPSDASGDQAVLYAMPWVNPTPPDAEIASVDLAYGPPGSQYGTPALLAITAARAAK